MRLFRFSTRHRYKSKRKFQIRKILTRPSSVKPIDKVSHIEIILKRVSKLVVRRIVRFQELTGCTP